MDKRAVRGEEKDRDNLSTDKDAKNMDRGGSSRVEGKDGGNSSTDKDAKNMDKRGSSRIEGKDGGNSYTDKDAKNMNRRGGSRVEGKDGGNSSTDKDAQTSRSSTKNESKSKQQMMLEKNIAKDQERKSKVNKESKEESQLATPSKSKVTKGKNADKDVDKSTSDNKVGKLTRSVVKKKQLEEKKREESSKSPIDVKKEYPGKVSVEHQKRSSKPIHSTDKAFLAIVSPLPSKIGATIPPLSELLKVSKQDIKDEKKRNLDPIASKVQHLLSLESEKKTTEVKYEICEVPPAMQYFNDIDEQDLILERDIQKIVQEICSESEQNLTETKSVGDDFEPQCSQVIDERKLNFDAENQQEISPENESNISESKPDGSKSTILQSSIDIDERKMNLDQDYSKIRQEFSSENETKLVESKSNVNESIQKLQCSKDIDDRNPNSNLQSSKMQEESTGMKVEVDESVPFQQDAKLNDIKERIQNLDLSESNTKKDVSTENKHKLISKTKEKEEVINLRRDVNLVFEFEANGNKNVFVDKDQYTVDKEKKIFNIGNGNVQLSFIDNKVCIFTQEGEINCSIQKNQVVFALTDSATQFDSSIEDSSSKDLCLKDADVFKEPGQTNATETTESCLLSPSDDLKCESGSKNTNMSTLKNDSCLEPMSVAQRHFQNITQNFLASVISSCNNFESDFLKFLHQTNEDH